MRFPRARRVGLLTGPVILPPWARQPSPAALGVASSARYLLPTKAGFTSSLDVDLYCYQQRLRQELAEAVSAVAGPWAPPDLPDQSETFSLAKQAS